MLLLHEIEVGYDLPVLQNNHKLAIPRHPNSSGITLVKGRNGSGKSTLLRSIAGLLTVIKGEINWNHLPISTARDQGKIRYLSDRLEFPGSFSVNEILCSLGYSRIHSSPFLQELDLPTKCEWRKLSTGQKQKVRLCLVLLELEKAELFIMDEPFSGLDLESRDAAMKLLYHGLFGTTKRLLICLHQDSFPQNWVENILLCEEGTFQLCLP